MVFHSVNGGPGRVDINMPFQHGNLMARAQADGLHIIFAQAAYKEGQSCATGVIGPEGTFIDRMPLGVEGVFVATINVTQMKAPRRPVLPPSDLADGLRYRADSASVADEVEKLHRLHLGGALTEAEFGGAKAAL